MKIIEKSTTPDGIPIQLEDWHGNNNEEYPDLYGFTIAAYPNSSVSGFYGYPKEGEPFRLAIPMNPDKDYPDNMVLADYRALKRGEKTLADLADYFRNGEHDQILFGKHKIDQNSMRKSND